MQNKKIQLWALDMSGYNCTVEYIAGKANACADLLFRHPDNVTVKSEIENSEQHDRTVVDVNDNLHEVNILDSNQFDQKYLDVVNYQTTTRLTNVIAQISQKLVLT